MALNMLKNILSTPEIDIVWSITRRSIESLQIFSLLLIPQFPWPTDILDGIENISWISFDATNSIYNATLITICTIITIYALIAASTLICECCDCLESIGTICECGQCDDLSEYIWWFIGDAILFGIFFIPIASILLEIFHCKNDHVFKNRNMECGDTEHILLCIWSCITFIFLIIFIYFRSNAHDVMQHNARLPSKIRHDIHNFDAYYSFFRLFAMVIIIIVAESSPIISSISLLLVFLIPIIFTIKQLPFVNMIYNYIRCAMDSFNVWSSFALFIVAVINDNQSYVGFIIWSCFPIFIIFCCVLCKLQFKNRPLSIHDLRDPEDDIDQAMSHQINFADYLKENEELTELLRGNENQCIMIRPKDVDQFLEYLQKKNVGNINDFYCIIGKNQSGNKREDEELKKWNDKQLDIFCNIIKECNNLIVFRMNGWIFENEQIFQIISILCSTKKNNLNIIDLGNNQLNIDDAKCILDIIEEKIKINQCFQNLKEINFVGNYINLKKWREQLIDIHTLGHLIVI